MELKEKIRSIPDFPKPGILFRDITTLLKDADAFQEVISIFAERYAPSAIDIIAAIESRGFIFGAALAARLRTGFVPIRKPGKLPGKTYTARYELEYGTDQIEMHVDAVSKGNKVLLIDDLLATGGTMHAACSLVEQAGGMVIECAFVVELADLKGRDKLTGYPVFSVVVY
ncbi:MAG: adenine phosphoribosyltransferase [Desulfobacterota bacterium]|nr:adenine phosphoribosyltransferase [Thermodesulfobacteriota bacterium]